MSAIFGMIGLEGQPVDQSVMERFQKEYEKCKIDRMEVKIENNIGLGCGIQYFTAEARRELLPIVDKEKGIYLTADCHLEERQRLIEELGTSQEEPDGSLIFMAYEKWKEEMAKHLRGAFSIVVYDETRKKVFLFSDQFATRCLFYQLADGILYFSTLFFPLLHATGLKYENNDRWLLDCISLRSPAMIIEPKECGVMGVYKLVSGTYIEWDKELKEVRYWDPYHDIKVDKSIGLAESEEIIQRVMKKAVREALRTDGKVGAQLSCGLDSSTVACIAAPILAEKGEKLYTYTSVPLKEAELPESGYLVYNETKGVEFICKNFSNMEPSFVDCSDRNYLAEVDYFIDLWEEPCKSEQNAVWVDEIFRQAGEKGCKILLGGSTGNCTISSGSFDDYLWECFTHFRWGEIPKVMDGLKALGVRRKRYVKNLLESIKEYYSWYFHKEQQDTYQNNVTRHDVGEANGVNKRLNKECLHHFPFKTNHKKRKEIYLIEANAQIGEIDTKYSLMHGVLFRDPIRNVDVVEACMRFPMECFCSSDWDRRLVRQCMEGIVPEEIRHDISHRGRQAGDNEYRIGIEWEHYCKKMEATLMGESCRRYLDADKITLLMNEIKTKGAEEDFMCTRMLVDAYSFARYLNRFSF